MATYIGWLLHQSKGGVFAGTLFVFPGALIVFLFSYAYVHYYDLGWVRASFEGIKAAVFVVVVDAVLKLRKRIVKDKTAIVISLFAFFLG